MYMHVEAITKYYCILAEYKQPTEADTDWAILTECVIGAGGVQRERDRGREGRVTEGEMERAKGEI